VDGRAAPAVSVRRVVLAERDRVLLGAGGRHADGHAVQREHRDRQLHRSGDGDHADLPAHRAGSGRTEDDRRGRHGRRDRRAAAGPTAGPPQTVLAGSTVTLDGSGSTGATSYLWKQTGGVTANLSSTTAIKPTFTMPNTPDPVIFQLTEIGRA